MAVERQVHFVLAVKWPDFSSKEVDFAVGKRSNRKFVVGSCFRSQSTTANHNMVLFTIRNTAATHDHSRCGCCVTIRTFHTRSCSSRSYYLAETPSFESSRTVSPIHNSSRCCILTTDHHMRTTAALAVATVSYILIAANHPITIRLKFLAL